MRVLVSLTLYFWFLSAAGQQQQKLLSLTSLDAGFLSAAITHTTVISQKLVADVTIGIGPGYDIAEGSHIVKTLPAVFASITPKYYYNLYKRAEKGKSLSFNSGNFLGARVKYSYPVFVKTDEIREALLVNAFWGLQRQLSKSWLFGAQGGIGYSWDVSSEYRFGTLYPALDFRFGYVLGKKVPKTAVK